LGAEKSPKSEKKGTWFQGFFWRVGLFRINYGLKKEGDGATRDKKET